MLASQAGAVATPSFVIGLIDPESPGRVLGLSFIEGAQPYLHFKAALDAALAAGGPEPAP